MKLPETPFNKRILSKIINYLTTREGCNTNEIKYTDEGAETVVTDSLGYVYEVNIKTLGRIQNGPTKE